MTTAPSSDFPARVVARYGRRFLVAGPQGGAGEDALPRGRRMDLVVGDRVQCAREHGVLVIEDVAPRRNLLFRADAQRTKPLAANVDQIALVFAARPVPQTEFLWRALVAARATGVRALAVLNKSDLPDGAVDARLEQLVALGAQGVRVSARTAPEAARGALLAHCHDCVTLFVGQSGMGKSTLLSLLAQADLRTGELTRHGSHGRQTTTATHWLDLPGGGAVIDSPGFHAFGLAHLDQAQLVEGLADFAAVLQEAGYACRFADCRHLEEPDCAIRAALATGRITPERYDFYRRLLAESSSRKDA